MNTQIQRGLAEGAKTSASEWQVQAEGEANFGPPALCRHPCDRAEKHQFGQMLRWIYADCSNKEGAGDNQHKKSEGPG